jgi:hypothetical protein
VNHLCRANAFLKSTTLPGEAVFREGQADNQMHVILAGEIAITVAGLAGPVSVVRGGECVGEMALLTAAVHSATATARMPVTGSGAKAVSGSAQGAELIHPAPHLLGPQAHGVREQRIIGVGIVRLAGLPDGAGSLEWNTAVLVSSIRLVHRGIVPGDLPPPLWSSPYSNGSSRAGFG